MSGALTERRERAGAVRALVLAASRGPDDPMARATGARHKALLKVGGVPMLRRVVRALRALPEVGEIVIVIDDASAAREALGELAEDVQIVPPAESAAASALKVLQQMFARAADAPVLITTGDHALLTPEMVREMLAAMRARPGADLLVGLARREVVKAAFPQVKRTWLRFGADAVTACNLFLLRDARALEAVRFWRRVEQNRKRPWRIALAFGILPLIRVLLGRASLREAFALAGRRLGIVAEPVLLSDARAAVDVDKPEDLVLAERILAEDREND